MRLGFLHALRGSLLEVILCQRTIASLLLVLLPFFAASSVFASETSLFEKTFIRAKGAPVTETVTFDVPVPTGSYKVLITNGAADGSSRCSSAVIFLNGAAIVSPSDLNQQVSSLIRPVELVNTNTLKVTLNSAPGSFLKITVISASTPDTIPPVLTVSTLSDGSWTNIEALNVSGMVTDNIGVNQLSVNNAIVTVAPDGSFSFPYVLKDGVNTITVTATDLAGNSTMDTRTINLDRSAPGLTIITPADNTKTIQSPLEVKGIVDEEATITARINGVDTAVVMNNNNFSFMAALTYGTNTIELTASDRAGNTSSAKRSVIFDDRNPLLAILNPPHDLTTNHANMVLTGTIDDLTTVVVTITMDGNIYTPAVTNGQFELPVTFTKEQTYQITVKALDEVGNETTLQRSVGYDITAAEITLDPVTSPTNLGAQVLTGTMEAGAMVSVSCPTAAMEAVTYPTAITWTAGIWNMREGDNEISVVAVDQTGNAGQPLTAVITVDLTAPAVNIISPVSGAYVNRNSVDVSGTVADATATTVTINHINASISGGSFNLTSVPLNEGPNSIIAVATDGVGHIGTDEISIISDTIPPSIIVEPTPQYTSQSTIEIRGRIEDQTASTVTIQGHTVSIPAGGGPYAITVVLTGGINSIAIQATDSAGNTSEATRTITADAVAPLVKIISPAAGAYISGHSVTVNGTVSDAISARVTVNSVDAVVADGGFTLSALSLSEGSNTIKAEAADAAGNIGSDEITITSDTIAPVIKITSPAPGLYINKGSTSVSGTVADATLTKITINGIEAAVSQGSFTLESVSLIEGSSTIRAVATDSAGNTGSDEITVISDTNAPAITIDPLPEYTKTGSVEIKGAVSDLTATTVTLRGQTLSLPVGGGPFSFTVNLSEGGNTLTVTAKDSAGNTAEVIRSVISDTILPIVTITSPASGSYINRNSAEISGTASDNNAITLTVNGIETALNQGVFLTTVFLSEGQNFVRAMTRDAAGNVGNAEIIVFSDTIPPTVTIDTPSSGIKTNIGTQLVSGSIADSSPITSATLNGSAITLSSGRYGQQYNLSEGMNTLSVSAVDAAGNEGSSSVIAILDSTSPGPPVIDPLPSITNLRNITATGHSEPNSIVKITNSGETNADSSGRFSIVLSLNSDSLNSFTARAYDELGNESLPADFSILQDSTPPVVLSHSLMADPKTTLLIPVSITFSEAIDPETVNASNITVLGPSGAITGGLSMSGNTVTFTSTADLPVNKMFTINAGSGIKDRAGNSLSPIYTASFDTTRGGPSIVLGEVYDDTVGLPLEGAEARILKTGGEVPDPAPTAHSDAMGRFSLKYEGVGGVAMIEISKAGYTKVIRTVFLQPNKSVTLFDARLAPVKTQTISASSGGTVAEGDTSLSVPPFGFSQDTVVSLAVVSPQGIGFRLPIGWSPVVGVDTSPGGIPFNSSATLSIRNTWPFNDLSRLAVAYFDTDAMAWVSGSAGLSGDYIVINVSKLGQYALIVPDTLPATPQMPSIPGEPILSSMDNPLSTGAASVKVVPPAVLSRQGAKGNTTVIVTTPSPIPSGTSIEVKISEKYDLKNGESVITEPFVQDITLYAYPDDGDANTISSGFPATPSKYYPLGTLYYGKVNIDVHLPTDQTGGDMIGAGGGTVTGPGGIGIIIPPSSLTEGSAITLSSLSEAGLPVSNPSNLTFAGAFVLQMEGGSFNAGIFPRIVLPGLTATDGTRVIVARVEPVGGKDELVAVATATASGGRLTIDRCIHQSQCIYSGRYAFYIPSRPFGFITGTVLKAEIPAPNAIVAVNNLPFRAASDSSGIVTMLSLSGAYTITASETLTGQKASVAGTIAGDETKAVRLDLSPVSLNVVDIVPYDKQTGAAVDSKVKITFSKAVESLTVTGSTFTVFEQPQLSTQPLISVPGRLSMTSQNTIAVFTPDAGLKPDTAYQVKLTEGIQDTFGVALTPFQFTFTTAEVLSNEALPPGKLKASMPDADGYVTVRGGVGLTYGGATVLIINRTKNIVLTVIANEDGSFEGRIRANISDEIVVQVKDLLGNTTTLSTGLMQNPDGTAAVGPRGGTIYGPGGIVAAIPEGAFDEAISVQITMMSEEVVKDVVMHPELVSGGVFKLDTGGVTANKEIKVSIPAPAWITPDHQVLLTKVENIRGYEELSLSCPAVLKDGKLVSTSPPFDGVYQNGMYRFVSWADASKGVAFVEVDAWVTRDVYTQSYVTGEYYLTGSVPYQKRRMMVVTLPVNRPFNIDLKSLEGEKLCGVSVTGPPARGQFYPQVVQLIYDPVPPEVVSNNKPNGSTGIMPGDDTITITLNEAADPSTVNNTTVIVKDSKGNIVEGTVYLAADGKTIVFIPKYGYKYGETYTMYINGVKDLGGNRLAPYSSSFSTFKPEIIATVPAPGAIDIDTYKNFVAVDSWHYEGVCSTPHSRITIIDVTDPAQPQKRGETLLYQTVYDIKALPEEDKIVATGFRQYCSPKSKRGLIEVVDVSDPAAPREALPFTGGVYLSWAAGSEEPPPNVPYQFGEPVEAALIGTNAFVANSGLGIQAIDLSRLTPPEEAAQASAIGGTFSTTANTDPNATMLDLFPSVSKAGTKILALKYNRLIILSPQLTALGELSGLNHAYSVTGVGSFPIDIDNDGNIGTFEDNDGDPTTSQQETFDLAFISTQDGIVIADVTTASSPRIIDMIPGEAGNVVVDRTRRIAYNGGLSIFSLKSLRPEPPANLGAKIDTDGDGVDDRVLLRMPEASGRNVLSEDGNLLYAADYSNGLVKVIRIGISHYDLSPTSDTQVSADEPEVPIILYAKDSSQGAPLTIRWNLEGAGGTLSEAETTSSNGIFTTTLTTSRTAGANYKITPKLVKENGILEDLGVTTGNITVVPGLATQIALTPTSTNYAADETGTITIDLAAKDAYGNLVSDGSAVAWTFEGQGSIAQLQEYTASGGSQAVIKAGDFAGIQTITAVVDNAQQSVQLELLPVDLSITSSISVVNAGTGTAQLNVTASSTASGGLTEGSKIKFFTTLGKVVGEGIVSSGRAIATFKATELTGAAVVTANIGNSYARTQIQIVPEPGLALSFEPKVMVGDQTVNGTIDGETLTGTSTVAYKTSSALKITGIPGEQIVVRLKNNREPVAWYFMNGLDGNVVDDIYHTHNGTASGVSLDTSNYTTGEASFKFDGTSKIEIPDAQDLHIDRLGLSVDVLPGESDIEQTVIRKDGSYLFSIVKDGTSYRARFDVTTDQGNHSITSAQTLTPDQWNKVQASLDNNQLKVSINETENDVTVPGSIRYTNSSIFVGDNLSGNLDNLQIIDLSKPILVTFGDGAESSQTTLDANGQATIQVYSAGNLRTQSPNEWFIEAKVFYKNIAESSKSSKLAVISSKLLWYVVNITQGAVIGDAEGISGASGDIAASFVIYGDVRDILLLAPKLAFGVADPGDKLVLNFAAIGVVSTIYPPADPFVATAKALAKKFAGSKKLTSVLSKVKDEVLKSNNIEQLKAIIERYSGLFKRSVTDDQYQTIIKKIFREQTSETDAIVMHAFDGLAKFEKAYGDQGAIALKKLSTRYGLDTTPDVAERILRDTIEASRKVADQLAAHGVTLTADAIEGIGVLMKYTSNPKKAETIVNSILNKVPKVPAAIKPQVMQNIFTWLKQAEDAAATQGMLGLEKTIKELASQPSKVQGGYHVLDYAANHVGWNRIRTMEARIENEVGVRVHDIVTKDGQRFELKNFTTYNYTGKVLDQLKRDLAMLSDDEIRKLRYVFRGSSAGADKMLKDMQKKADKILSRRPDQFKGVFTTVTNIEFLNKTVPF